MSDYQAAGDGYTCEMIDDVTHGSSNAHEYWDEQATPNYAKGAIPRRDTGDPAAAGSSIARSVVNRR